MSQEQIVHFENSAAIRLSPAAMAELGVQVGDLVEVSVENQVVVVRALSEAERRQRIEEATKDTFDRRDSAYAKLAEGHR